MKKTILFLAVFVGFNITKTDINMVKIIKGEKEFYSSKKEDIEKLIIDDLLSLFKEYESKSDNKEKLASSTSNRWRTFSAKYTYAFTKYKVEVLVGFEYQNVQLLNEKAKSELVESVKNAVKDLLNHEVFGIRVIPCGITIYSLISKIEEIK
jgi:5-methylthioribose kinase